MKCSEVKERLIEYLDGQFEASQLRSIEEHLQSCPDCRRELESMRELNTGLKQEVPAMWESIEPSPAFLNRLKYMELEPEKASILSFFDPLVVLFQKHRPVVAAGLTVLVAIVLALTIPGIISEDSDETEMVAAAPSATTANEEAFNVADRDMVSAVSQGESQSKGIGGGETAVPPSATTGLNGTSLSWETEGAESPMPMPTPFPSTMPGESLVIPAPTVPPAMECTDASTAFYGHWADEENPAARIALAFPGVQQALEGKSITCLEILHDVNLEGYVCSGSTVSIAVDETAPAAPLLYVCVEAGSVTFVKTFPSE